VTDTDKKNESITTRIDELIATFEKIGTWEDRYKKIIAMGKELSPMEDQYRTEEFKVRGCQSQVWLHAAKNTHGRLQIHADSDAMIVRGLVAIIVYVYSGATPDEILTTPPTFFKRLGLEQHLSASRANGFMAMIKQIVVYAMALSVQ
jgi:cysteine desulfuration protein SufE